MPRPSQLYLLAYNSLQSLGWSLALFRLLACLAPPVSVHPAYALAGDLICFLQTCAVLETVHAAVGLVPTSPFLAFLQWGGRTHFVLALLRQIPEVRTDGHCKIPVRLRGQNVQGSPSVFITFMAWSISEVIRYSHYALTTLKVCPAWLTYLRYTAFIPLYPIGVGPGEMWTIYQALPFVKERELYSGLFAKFSMSYHSFLVGGLLCYPLLWLKLYLHVFKQRKSKLGKVDRRKKRA
ncbi:very-long-chain (3R)-3-hydroxyacyl-CoA dehydratase 2-like isoform X1 [Lolium rigidum]|uniref:very-long-chain (3R)-3-hydroxyacyl-CoA dehydratase 2-like isoform X1 n=1 Tax=Lolium rigidum TaxID=89674 RepID=UPI001F5E0C32|nr:very-long-chain (3R)-3-hydroxyacyl-CoA dehydratase 2-like isoform X1 [Lolium rigidum]